MDKYTIKFSKKSKFDMVKIINYIGNELKQPELSEEYFNLFMTEINELNMLPKRNPTVKGKAPSGTERRKLLIKNYVVLYLIDELNNMVYIERIVYGASNWIKEL